MPSDPTALDTELFEKFNNEILAAADLSGETISWRDGLKPLGPVFRNANLIDPKPRIEVKPPTPVKLTGVVDDIATCKRAASAINELLHETNTVEKTIAIGAEYAKLHDQLVRNSKFDTTRLGWHQAFDQEQKLFKHTRRHAEYFITIHHALVGNALPTSKLPHALRPLLLIAQVLIREKVTDAHLKTLLDEGKIAPLTTEAEVKEALGLKSRSKSDAAATSDIIQSAPDLVAILNAATDDEVKAALKRTKKDVPWLLRVIPEEWLSELQARVINLRNAKENRRAKGSRRGRSHSPQCAV